MKAMGDVQGILLAMQGKLKESVYHAGMQGNRILFAMVDQGVKAALLPIGRSEIELLEPIDASGGVAKFRIKLDDSDLTIGAHTHCWSQCRKPDCQK